MVHTFNHKTWEAEAVRSLDLCEFQVSQVYRENSKTTRVVTLGNLVSKTQQNKTFELQEQNKCLIEPEFIRGISVFSGLHYKSGGGHSFQEKKSSYNSRRNQGCLETDLCNKAINCWHPYSSMASRKWLDQKGTMIRTNGSILKSCGQIAV